MDSNKIKKGLGRGLSSLIGETKVQNSVNKLSISNLSSKDLDTLFIVAGCAGAGKSTIIRTSHLLNLPLFGDDFHQKFREA